MIYTTLNKIREHGPCIMGWQKLLKHLGKTKADDEQLSLVDILKTNGLDDALWCLRATDGYDKEFRLYAVWCARQVQHLMKDDRSIQALDVAERYAHGKATNEELKAVSDAAWDAARDSARDAAWDAAWGAKAAAWAAARADWGAARGAGAARDARGAVWDAARATQEKEFIRMCENAHDIKE